MKVGFVQFNPIFGEKENNIARTVELIRTAHDADLLVLPELCTTGYLFESREELATMAEHIPDGPSVRAWIEVTQEMKRYIVAGIAEKDGSSLYNSAVLIGPSGYIGVYRKWHLFHKEKNLFDPGSDSLQVYDIGKARIGILICFDWIFPEISRIFALKGADILCHPANLVLPYAQRAMRTRSIENRVFTITANRIGSDVRSFGELHFTGRSQVISPDMDVLCSAGEETEAVKTTEIDPMEARDNHVTPNNDIFEDRRVTLYTDLLKRNERCTDNVNDAE